MNEHFHKDFYSETKRIHDEDLKELNHGEGRAFAKLLKENKEKASKALRVFSKNLGTEAKETAEASKILYKFVKSGKVSKEEEMELRTQVYDLLKMVGIGIPFFMIPGSSLLLPFLIKIASKYDINLLPTSFTKDETEEE